MTKPSPYELGYRTVATARAVILSPANVVPLPWVQIVLQEQSEHDFNAARTKLSVMREAAIIRDRLLDENELISFGELT